MKKASIILVLFFFAVTNLLAHTEPSDSSYWHPKPRNYEVKQAFEIESLVPMFLTGGYHYAVCYRYHQFRVRASLINGGDYDAEPAGLKNSSADFKRYYKTSPGFFAGYNIWRNLELYTFLEMHTFAIEQKSTGIKKNIHTTDFGGGISYQFFIGHYFYIQPGLHLYLRTDKSLDFSGVQYSIPNVDFAPVLRLGARLWRKY